MDRVFAKDSTAALNSGESSLNVKPIRKLYNLLYLLLSEELTFEKEELLHFYLIVQLNVSCRNLLVSTIIFVSKIDGIGE